MVDKLPKISLEEVKKIPIQSLMKMIDKAKNYLKSDKTMKRICSEYEVSINILDLIPTCFADLDVSAKTDGGIVYLNYKLLCDGDFFKDYSYLCHEYSHVFQQCLGDKPTKGSDDGDYLENPYEEEAFQNQVEFISKQQGEGAAEKYVDKLLNHHEVTDHDEKEDKKEELMARVSE